MTIEERAYKHYPKQREFKATYRCGLIDGKREGYIKGATEQKEIDDALMFAEREKAFINGYGVAKKELIEKACEWLKMYDITFTQTPSMLEDFKKAMEE